MFWQGILAHMVLLWTFFFNAPMCKRIQIKSVSSSRRMKIATWAQDLDEVIACFSPFLGPTLHSTKAWLNVEVDLFEASQNSLAFVQLLVISGLKLEKVPVHVSQRISVPKTLLSAR